MRLKERLTPYFYTCLTPCYLLCEGVQRLTSDAQILDAPSAILNGSMTHNLHTRPEYELQARAVISNALHRELVGLTLHEKCANV